MNKTSKKTISKKKPKILVAEDDRFYVKLFEEKLPQVGADVLVAKDGKQALKVIEKFKPDMLILDLVMPEVDGYEVLKKVRKNGDYKNMKILVLTNLGSNGEVAKKTKEMGADECFTKANISVDEMLEKVKVFLQQSR